MKKGKRFIVHVLLMVASVVLFLTINTYASTTTWINESRDYSVGETVGGWEILEYKDAVAYNSNGVWSTYGTSGGGTRSNGASMLWFYYGGSSAEVTFSTPSTAVAFMLESDSNDMYVNLYVDNELVLSNFFMLDLPGIISYPDWQVGTFIVSGLSYATHTVRIANIDTSSYRDDFHIYGAAAVSSVPVPGTLWLLLSGIAGLIGIKRR